ncbi:hypothetical protein C8Q76DRAFT_404761 [Earliella scabrosa]|nr:hypothetical protein C8Q76DRAFT_404761 [Earliella scabrosa]
MSFISRNVYLYYVKSAIPRILGRGVQDALDPNKGYAHVASTCTLIKNATTVALAIISDFIMVYRTFIVWNLNVLVIVVPVLLLLGDLGLGVWSLWTLAHIGPGDNAISSAPTTRVRYFFVVTFAVNALCAGLICWKIWRIHASIPRHVSSVSSSPISRVLEVFIETATLYCAHLLCIIISASVGASIFFIFLDMLPPVTALVFTMIMVRTRPSENPDATLPSIHFWSVDSNVARDEPKVDQTRHSLRISLAGDVNLTLEVVSRAGFDGHPELVRPPQALHRGRIWMYMGNDGESKC